MAELDSKLETTFSASASLVALVGDRFYNSDLPQLPTYPAIVYTVFITQVHTFDDDSDQALVQIDLFGAKSELISLRSVIRDVMKNAIEFKALFDSHVPSPFNYDLNIYRETISFNVWYNR